MDGHCFEGLQFCGCTRKYPHLSQLSCRLCCRSLHVAHASLLARTTAALNTESAGYIGYAQILGMFVFMYESSSKSVSESRW